MLTEPEVVELFRPAVRRDQGAGHHADDRHGPAGTSSAGIRLAGRAGRVARLAGRGDVPPVGLPFWKYNVIDMEREMEVEAGAPVTTAVTGDDRVLAAVLPAGRYATLRYTGHPGGLARGRVAAGVGRAANLTFDVKHAEGGDRWAACCSRLPGFGSCTRAGSSALSSGMRACFFGRELSPATTIRFSGISGSVFLSATGVFCLVLAIRESFKI